MSMTRDVSPPPLKRRRVDQERSSSLDSNLLIYSWNINGIQPFIQQSIKSFFISNSNDSDSEPSRASLRDFLRHHQWPTILCLQEVKINPGDKTAIRAVHAAVRSPSKVNPKESYSGNSKGTLKVSNPTPPADEPDYEAHFCLPQDKHNARGFGRKVYGVCCVIRKDYSETQVEAIQPVNWDKEGRFLVIKTKPQGTLPKLAIINIYAVNGTDNPYKCSITGQFIGTRHDRKLQVHALLQEEVRSLESQGYGVVLAGDMNIARARIDGCPNLRTFPQQHCVNRADFEAKFFAAAGENMKHVESESASGLKSEDRADAAAADDSGGIGLGMIDTFRHLHPTQKAYTYYPRQLTFGDSCDRVDMIIISASLRRHLVGAGIFATPKDRGTSDHVPLYARLTRSNEKDESGTDR